MCANIYSSIVDRYESHGYFEQKFRRWIKNFLKSDGIFHLPTEKKKKEKDRFTYRFLQDHLISLDNFNRSIGFLDTSINSLYKA